MTQKELLYVEDAIGHEQNIIGIVEDAINTVDDNNLASFLSDELKKHNELKDKLIKLLEDEAK